MKTSTEILKELQDLKKSFESMAKAEPEMPESQPAPEAQPAPGQGGNDMIATLMQAIEGMPKEELAQLVQAIQEKLSQPEPQEMAKSIQAMTEVMASMANEIKLLKSQKQPTETKVVTTTVNKSTAVDFADIETVSKTTNSPEPIKVLKKSQLFAKIKDDMSIPDSIFSALDQLPENNPKAMLALYQAAEKKGIKLPTE